MEYLQIIMRYAIIFVINFVANRLLQNAFVDFHWTFVPYATMLVTDERERFQYEPVTAFLYK